MEQFCILHTDFTSPDFHRFQKYNLKMYLSNTTKPANIIKGVSAKIDISTFQKFLSEMFERIKKKHSGYMKSLPLDSSVCPFF